MDIYEALCADWEKVACLLDALPNTKSDYLRLRATDPAYLDPYARAALFLYLNKAGFRGLFRVNAKGRFNVPYGAYEERRYYDPDNLRGFAGRLRHVELRRGDFEVITGAHGASPVVGFFASVSRNSATSGGSGRFPSAKISLLSCGTPRFYRGIPGWDKQSGSLPYKSIPLLKSPVYPASHFAVLLFLRLAVFLCRRERVVQNRGNRGKHLIEVCRFYPRRDGRWSEIVCRRNQHRESTARAIHKLVDRCLGPLSASSCGRLIAETVSTLATE